VPVSLPTAYYQLFLDSELNNSSGYFTATDMSLEHAQRAKVDAILSRCDLQPSMRFLDVGCGWGAAVRIAAAEHGVRAIGITIQPEQYEYAVDRHARESPGASMDFRLQRWEEFTEPVDRMICVNSFENFDDKSSFLPHCRRLLPASGKLVMLTVTADRPIYRVVSKDDIVGHAESAGFDVAVSDSLAEHYIRTLECFVANIERRRPEALEIVTADQLARSVEFYTTSAALLRRGKNDMYEFTLTAR
jgi:cyclopropane-fatty-acyl-phospholipid synthase